MRCCSCPSARAPLLPARAPLSRPHTALLVARQPRLACAHTRWPQQERAQRAPPAREQAGLPSAARPGVAGRRQVCAPRPPPLHASSGPAPLQPADAPPVAPFDLHPSTGHRSWARFRCCACTSRACRSSLTLPSRTWTRWRPRTRCATATSRLRPPWKRACGGVVLNDTRDRCGQP